eukprot:GHUV01002306.1.p1 GENE.GHUV01002306.1~~GHUV01002306.1.p1  ORF type:complete len:218 (+),score=65.23 GHUV01002306.1:62-715(+)
MHATMSSTTLAKAGPCKGAFRSARPQTRTISCHAVKSEAAAESLSRRAALTASFLATAPLFVPKAWALIPDEEDEELLERAKANRQKRLAAQKETTREFLRLEGIKDKQLDTELIPVQKAVYQLAKSGSQLEAGDLKGVSSTLSSGWVEDFQRATVALDASDAEKAQATAIFDGITSLKASAGSGDLKGSKRQYVALVAAVEDWARSTGLSTNLKGL